MPLGAPKEAYAQGAANVALATSVETVVCTLSGVDATPGGDQVVIQGNAVMNTGTGTTDVTLRIRRGADATGVEVGSYAEQVAGAGQEVTVEIQAEDSPGEVAGESYVLTVQQVGATANGTCSSSSLLATY